MADIVPRVSTSKLNLRNEILTELSFHMLNESLHGGRGGGKGGGYKIFQAIQRKH